MSVYRARTSLQHLIRSCQESFYGLDRQTIKTLSIKDATKLVQEPSARGTKKLLNIIKKQAVVLIGHLFKIGLRVLFVNMS
jgi:hypothetical protein